MTRQPQPRVLVIRGGAIGDFILTLPAVRLLRESLPGCHIEVMGSPGIVELAAKAGLAEATRSLEHRSMAMLFAKAAPIDEALAEYLRSFNLVISYLYDPDGYFRASLERAGVKTVVDCPHRMQPGQGHAARQLAQPLEKLAMFMDGEDWRRPLFPRPEPPAHFGRVALHPGSGSTQKNWPVTHWIRLGQQLVEGWPSVTLTLVTGEAEEARGVTELFRKEWAHLPHEHWHALPLAALADRLAQCDLFLGHDSGISHLAAACGVPCQLLFGPTDPQVWAPPQAAVEVIVAPHEDLGTLPYEHVWQNLVTGLVSKL